MSIYPARATDADRVTCATMIAAFYATNGRAAKQYDVAAELGWSITRAANACRALQEGGVIVSGYMIAPPRPAAGDQGGDA